MGKCHGDEGRYNHTEDKSVAGMGVMPQDNLSNFSTTWRRSEFIFLVDFSKTRETPNPWRILTPVSHINTYGKDIQCNHLFGFFNN